MAITSLFVFVLDTILQCQFYFGLTILNFDSEGSFVQSDHCSQPLISMFVSDCAHPGSLGQARRRLGIGRTPDYGHGTPLRLEMLWNWQ